MKKTYNKYVKLFYNERETLQKQDFSKWLKLEMPFMKIIKAIKKLEKNYIITIATNNRKSSIEPFLKNYNIKPRIISDSTINIDKKEQLKFIKNKLKANYNDIHFVDDQIKHFPELLRLKIHCYLAVWGYNNKKQRQEARNEEVVLVNENNFFKTLSKTD